MKVALEEFIKSTGPGGIKRWREGLKKLSNASIPLFPPTGFVSEAERPVFVMPFCLKNLKDIKSHWQPIEEAKMIFRQELNEHGYELDDYLQLGSVKGVPMIYDFSDLKKT